MSEKTKSEKSDFQVFLRQVAADLASQLDPRFGSDEITLIYETLREATLESWKNGLEAGRKRAFQKSKTARKNS